MLGVSRSSLYYRPRAVSGDDLFLMWAIDGQYLETPFYGSRRIRVWLERQGMVVSRKRVQRLMRIMGLRAIYCQPRTSRPAPEHRVHPYLLRNAQITRTNQVWAADITYLPMARGFLYLVPIMDWHSRYVVAWRLSNTLEAGFCAEALQETHALCALGHRLVEAGHSVLFAPAYRWVIGDQGLPECPKAALPQPRVGEEVDIPAVSGQAHCIQGRPDLSSPSPPFHWASLAPVCH